MTPSNYRAGGAQTDIRFAVGECSLGSILVAQSDRGICAILLGDDPDSLAHDLQDRFPKANLIGGAPLLSGSWRKWSDLSKCRHSASISLSMSAEPPFSSAYGSRCGAFPWARP